MLTTESTNTTPSDTTAPAYYDAQGEPYIVTTTYKDFPADLLKAIVTFASCDETRPQIGGIHFAASTGDVVATDGHTMVRVSVKATGARGDWTVDRATILAACKAAGKGGTVTLVRDGARVTLICATKRGQISQIIAEIGFLPFPRWEMVVPKPGKIAAHWVNASYLGRIEAVAAALGSDGVELIGCADKFAPILYQTADGRANVVIMPRRAP